ncbi:MAG TPA: DUF2179 domain-containing protein [Anaerolineales bacterium]|nr:DUF2179 domain-containing protein [Anaerolineales bacterium]
METFDWYTWVILPLIVFLARFVDVTLGTMRIIFLSRGRKILAPALGFMEVFIWITVVSQIVGGANNNVLAYLAYAAGFAVGNYVGMVIEEKLAIGTLVVRAILPKNGKALVRRLREGGYGVTYVDGHGASGEVILIYTIVMRRELEQVVGIIQDTAPKAFFTVEELRSVQQGIFPVRATALQYDLSARKKK